MGSMGTQFIMNCPVCTQEGRNSKLIMRPGLGHQCEFNGAHQWNDFDALMAARPKTVQLKVPAKVNPNNVSVPVSLPMGTYNAALQRFGDRLDSTLTALVGAMLDPDAFVVLGQDLQEIHELTNQKMKSSRTIVGLVRTLLQEKADAILAAEKSKNNATMARFGRVEGQDVTFTAVEKSDVQYLESRAAALNKPLPKLVAEFIHQAAKQDWIKVKA